jgi:dTDP-4-amino-4,6-dideoxygalactose transaminase
MQNMVLSHHEMKVPFIDLRAQYQTIKQEIQQALDGVLTSQKFILSEEVANFENEIAELTTTRFAIGCASGTDALLLSLRALNIGRGDEVITTSYSFFATAGMIAWLNAKPVFVDIDSTTFNLQPDQVESKITSKTKAIVAVHLFGQCCQIERLLTLGIPVIEDAAQAIGASRYGKPAGSMGVNGCFSFFPTKNLGAYGDAGMITTNDDELAKKIRMLRAHGQDNHRYHHTLIGTNSRLDEIQAAILRAKLRHLNRWNDRRSQNAAFYTQNLKQLPVALPAIDQGNTSNYHQYVIRCKNRDHLKNHLADQGIGSAVYYPVPLPHQLCFSDLAHKPGDFPRAEECADTSLALPIHPELTREQMEYVVFQISKFFQ